MPEEPHGQRHLHATASDDARPASTTSAAAVSGGSRATVPSAGGVASVMSGEGDDHNDDGGERKRRRREEAFPAGARASTESEEADSDIGNVTVPIRSANGVVHKRPNTSVTTARRKASGVAVMENCTVVCTTTNQGPGSAAANATMAPSEPDEAELLLRLGLEAAGKMVDAASLTAEVNRFLIDEKENCRGQSPVKKAPFSYRLSDKEAWADVKAVYDMAGAPGKGKRRRR